MAAKKTEVCLGDELMRKLSSLVSRLTDVADRLDNAKAEVSFKKSVSNFDTASSPSAFFETNTRSRITAIEEARRIYSQRQQRAALFQNSDIFGEPAWDILLDLYVAAHENRLVSVSSAGIASGAAESTALRWLEILQDSQLIERENDPHDGRRVHVRLTKRAQAAMDTYFESAG